MIDWVAGVVASGGPGGVFLLMFLENLFPPIPSEVIMPLAGFAAARQEMGLVQALVAGILGTVLGNAVWYELARAIGAERIRPLVERHGRWFAVSGEDFSRAEQTLKRHGAVALFFGRMLPGIRTVISIPAGLVRIPRASFLLWTTLGSTVWVGMLTMAGYALEERYNQVSWVMEPLGWLVLVAFLGSYAWHLWRTRRRAG
jgi:membrane protein DedA with SNARE-associated domain